MPETSGRIACANSCMPQITSGINNFYANMIHSILLAIGYMMNKQESERQLGYG